MLIWINLYVVVYLYLMVSLHIILRNIISGKLNTNSIIFAHYYIVKFSKFKSIYYWILLSLAGLPPFLFFFVKSNIIISVMGNVTFFCSTLIFFSFFLNMLFYTQLFIKKNYNFEDMNLFNHKNQKCNPKTIYRIVVILILMTFSIAFIPDLYFITNLFF
jgi:hypothetical protein